MPAQTAQQSDDVVFHEDAGVLEADEYLVAPVHVHGAELFVGHFHVDGLAVLGVQLKLGVGARRLDAVNDRLDGGFINDIYQRSGGRSE